ncbi:MAG TPA: trypsin-like serine protease [Gelria sp.]|jgi:serine protease Do|nr:trypsin-like serine protease [Gelria sp.]
MNRQAVRGILYFLIFFCVGLGVVAIFNHKSPSSKPIAGPEEIVVSGAISKVAAQVSPSVVGITNLSSDGDIFNQRKVETTGSGVIIDSQGHIVSNNHVVKDAQGLIVTLADGTEKEAKIIGTDPRTDLALIKIKVERKVTPVQFGDSDKLVVGEEVVAIGNPLGLRFARSVTAGVVSGLNRLLTTEEGFTFRLIQTDAAINPGNSGGALVNLQGQLVGINTVKIAAEGFEGMGFSIPSNQVRMVVEDIKKHGRVLRPLMGIKIIGEISGDEARYFNLPVASGVVIEPAAGGPADKAGIKRYDIVSSLDGVKIETASQLQDLIFGKKIGQVVKLQLVRLPRTQVGQIEVKTIKVKLDK